MTLPSLCSAIRSQLYFSQISAWCDLIKKSDKTIYETGRVIYTTPPTTSAAGDLATTTANATATTMQPTPVTNPATLLTTTSTQQQQQQQQQTNTVTSGAGGVSGLGSGVGVVGGGCSKKAPRLNIFYRIKQYDSTACFNSKPNVHNFPNVNISENCCVSVCLKSLPRITGGIPKVGSTTATATTIQAQISPTIGLTSSSVNGNSAELNKNKKTKAESNSTTTNANYKPTTTILTMNCDNNLKELQQQKSITATTSSRCSSSSLSPSTFFQNGKNSKISEDQRNLEHLQNQDIDFDYEEQQVDLNAGGDSTNISCSSSLVGGNDCDSSNSSFSTNNCGNLSHREKQLLKYRKRMMKRDKKQQLRKTNENVIQTESKMEQGDDDEDDNDVDDDNIHHNNECSNSEIKGESSKELNKFSNNTSLEKGQRQQQQQQQQLPNNHTSSSSSSNSIPSSSILTQLNQNHHPHQQQHVKMISTGTQTITNSCTSCGNEKSMICLKCNNFKTISSTNFEEIMEAETLSSSSTSSSSASSLSSSDIIQIPRNKAELLLQAIQRTPKSNKKHKHKSKDSKQMAAIKPQQPTTVTTPLIIPNSTSNLNRKSSSHSPQMNGDNSSNSSNTNNSLNNRNSNQNSNNIMMVGCQVCKRQKTQHHFNQPSSSAIEELSSEDNNSLSNNCSSANGIDTTNTALIISTNHTTTDDGGCGVADGEDDGDNEKDGGRILEDLDCVDNVSIVIDDVEQHGNGVMSAGKSSSCDDFNEHEIMEEVSSR